MIAHENELAAISITKTMMGENDQCRPQRIRIEPHCWSGEKTSNPCLYGEQSSSLVSGCSGMNSWCRHEGDAAEGGRNGILSIIGASSRCKSRASDGEGGSKETLAESCCRCEQFPVVVQPAGHVVEKRSRCDVPRRLLAVAERPLAAEGDDELDAFRAPAPTGNAVYSSARGSSV